MRRIFIGDIHGCIDPLRALLSAVGFRPGHDVLHPVGDLVNKGPDSMAVLSLLAGAHALPVLGNHDFAWLQQGSCTDATLERWLREQPVVRVMDDVILVHAGVHPRWSEGHLLRLNADEVYFAVNVRYCTAEGELPERDWPPPGLPFAPWDRWYGGVKRVVFGHWARRGLVRTERVVGLDSGCLYGGKLSAWIAEEDRVVQVPGWVPT